MMMMFLSANYVIARAKLNQAMDTSDFSEIEGERSTSRKRRPTCVSSDSESDEDSIHRGRAKSSKVSKVSETVDREYQQPIVPAFPSEQAEPDSDSTAVTLHEPEPGSESTSRVPDNQQQSNAEVAAVRSQMNCQSCEEFQTPVTSRQTGPQSTSRPQQTIG